MQRNTLNRGLIALVASTLIAVGVCVAPAAALADTDVVDPAYASVAVYDSGAKVVRSCQLKVRLMMKTNGKIEGSGAANCTNEYATVTFVMSTWGFDPLPPSTISSSGYAPLIWDSRVLTSLINMKNIRSANVCGMATTVVTRRTFGTCTLNWTRAPGVPAV